jgi:hypothetical protein
MMLFSRCLVVAGALCGTALGLTLAEAPARAAGAGAAATNQPSGQAALQRPSYAERLEQLKRDNPEQYAEMMRRRDEYRQSMEKKNRARADFFAAVSTKNMSEAQRQNHQKLIEAIKAIDQLKAQTMAGEQQGPDVRRKLAEASSGLRDLYAAERRFLLEETVRSLGCSGTNVTAYADHLQAIFDYTSALGVSERVVPSGGR